MKRFVLLLALVGCWTKSHDSSSSSSTESSSITSGGGGGGGGGALPEYKLKPIDPSEAQDIPTLKDRVGSAVSKWLSEDTTPDGWILTYETPHRDNVQDEKTLHVELKVIGVYYGVYVRRMINGQPFKCVTQTIEKREDIARVVAACKTAKPD